MTERRRTALKKLQGLDKRIEAAEGEVRDFDPLFAEVEEPALVLEGEVGTTRSRLQEMKLAERRLELATEEKGVRVKRLEERLGSVRNLREEAAVSAELEMVRRALQSDEQEALTLIDQIRKLEERLTELEEAYAEARELVHPRMADLEERRSVAQGSLAELRQERIDFAAGMEKSELRLYEAIRSGGRTVAVAELTEDGACGNCFGMVPLQLQNEIRHGEDLIRCEGCGVILAAADPESVAAEKARVEAEASAAAAEAEAAVAAAAEAAETPTEDSDPTEAPQEETEDEPTAEAQDASDAEPEASADIEAVAVDETPDDAARRPLEPARAEAVAPARGAAEEEDQQEQGEE